MTKEELGDWWTSLTVPQKERIASKAATKASGTPTEVHYPACTTWWNSIDEDRKNAIHDHCTNAHGYLLPEWKEGDSYSY